MNDGLTVVENENDTEIESGSEKEATSVHAGRGGGEGVPHDT